MDEKPTFTYKILSRDENLPRQYWKECTICLDYCDIVVKVGDREVLATCISCAEELAKVLTEKLTAYRAKQ